MGVLLEFSTIVYVRHVEHQENIFGILSSVFRIFRKPLLLDPKKATNITLAAIYLHNYLRNSPSKNIYCPSGTFDSECLDTRVTIYQDLGEQIM